MSNLNWLLSTANAPIKYNLTKDISLHDELINNSEAKYWLGSLKGRSDDNNIGDIHGSHDYRIENILGKCFILGLDKNIPEFYDAVKFILNYLDDHIRLHEPKDLSFGKIYHYRDNEKVLSCFLPFLGFHSDPAVTEIVKKRLDITYNFTKQNRFDIYIDVSDLSGIKKEWKPFIIDPILYESGHIALPDMHDMVLFAGIYNHLSDEEKVKAERAAEWLLSKESDKISRRYGYFYIKGGQYSTKAVIFKPFIADTESNEYDKGDFQSLIFNLFIFSHFKASRVSMKFKKALNYLESFKNKEGRYKFPSHLIAEKKDNFVITGGHMNLGENKKVNYLAN